MHYYKLSWIHSDYDSFSEDYVILLHEQKFSNSEFEDMV